MADPADGPVTTRRTAAVLAMELETPELDPERVGPTLSSIVDAIRPDVVPFGGWLDAGVGGRVTVVFVAPFVHDAPALAAVLAADAVRRRLDSIDPSTLLTWRGGIATGEVILEGAEVGSTSIFGNPLTVSRRLARDASDGEIVLAEDALASMGSMVTVAPRVDGSWSLRDVEQTERRVEGLELAGRRREMDALLAAFDRVAQRSICSRIVVAGGPGLGKSRLVEAYIGEVQKQAHVLLGHCDPAGGRAMRPLAEMIERFLASIPGADHRSRLEAFLGDVEGADQICGDLMHLLGRSTTVSTTASISWSLRQFIERLALERPVVLVFEDLHWGRELLIDTIEYLTGFITEHPVLILCAARPELLDRSEALKFESGTNEVVALRPLDLDGTAELLAAFLGFPPPDGLAAGVYEISRGNPLFAIEVAEEWRERSSSRSGAGDLSLNVPSSLQALLETRVAAVEPDIAPVLRAAAVGGERFDVAQVSAVVGGDPMSTVMHLARLADHHLVEPDRSPAVLGRDEFRFAHALIQETVYAMTEKAHRVELHERFADLQTQVAGSIDSHERSGYHLERAAALSAELGESSERVESLRGRAALLFAKAGRELMSSGDVSGVAALLQRALDLFPERDQEWSNTAIDLADVLVQLGDFERARSLTREVGDLAERSASAARKERAALAAGWLQASTIDAPQADLVSDLEALAPFFERRGDHTALAKLYLGLAECHWLEGECAAVIDRLKHAMTHSIASPSQRHLGRMAPFMASALLWGPTHAEKALQASERLMGMAAADRLAQARIKVILGALEALRGDFERGAMLAREGVSAHEEAGQTVVNLVMTQFTALIALLGGDVEAADAELERGIAGMRVQGLEGHLATSLAMLAQVKYRLGRSEQAAALVQEATTIAERDVTVMSDVSHVMAHLAADRGDADAARAHLAEGKAAGAGRDTLLAKCHLAVESALVERKLGDAAAAERAQAEALALCDAKGAVAMAARLHVAKRT